MRRLVLISILFIFVSSFISGQSIYDLGVPGTNYDISRDNNGNIHLVWVNSDNYKRLFYGRIVNNALTGVETVDLVYKVHVRFTRPRMAVQPNGSTIHVTYISPGPGSYLVHLWRDSGGTWRENVVWDKGTSKYYMAFPAVGVDASGNVHLVAQRWYGEVQNYIAYWRKSGGTWSSYVSIESNNSVPWRDVSMFTDKNGGVHATWKTGQLVYGRYRYAANGASLANSTTINIPKDPDTGNMVSFGDTYVTDNGDVHHVYMNYASVTLWHTVKRNGSNTFGELTLAGVVNNCESCGSYLYENPWPAIGVAPDGTPVIAWAENRKSGTVNYINVAYKEGLNWVPTIIDQTALIDREGRPVIAVLGTSGYLVWRGGDGNLKLLVYTLGEATGVLSPNGNEEWEVGQSNDIIWNLEDATGNFDINLYKNDINLGPIISDFDDTATPGKYTWTTIALEDGTPIAAGTDYKIEVKAVNNSDSDISDNNFTLKITPGVTVTAPNGGEIWNITDTYNVTWSSKGMTGNVGIKLFRGGISLGYIALDVPISTETYSWTISDIIGVGPIAPGTNYQIQIKQSGVANDLSDAVFTIASAGTPSITVTAPNGGENWDLGGTYNVTWTSSAMTGNVGIKLFRGGISLGYIALDVPVSAGTYSWTISDIIGVGPITPGISYQIQLKQSGIASDLSDAVFTIASAGTPSITVTSPNGGESWDLGSTHNITWTSSAMTGNVGIKLFRGGISLGYVALDVPVSAGTYSWTISDIIGVGPITPGTTYQIQVKQSGVAGDLSDAVFTIASAGTPSITVTAPNGGENWDLGSTHNVTWTSSAMTGNVGIKLFRGGISLGYIALDVPVSAGTYSWTISDIIGVGPITPGTTYQIQVKQSGVAGDLSDAVFTISSAGTPSITVIAPNGGENWNLGGTYNVTWTSSAMTGNVGIKLFQGGISLGYIALDVPVSAGTYSWTISDIIGVGPIVPGPTYQIQIKQSGVAGDLSDAVFTISPAI